MTNHPNHSQSTDLRYIVYSVASHNALAAAALPQHARHCAMHIHKFDSDDMLVVFSTRSRDDLDRFDGGRWPRDAKIVWRGSNELARQYQNR